MPSGGIGRNVYLFKGDGHRREKLITQSLPDNTGRSARRAKAAGDVPLYLLQTNDLKDRVNNALWRDTPGPNYIHFPKWLGSWFYDELTYEERDSDGKWSKPGRGANEAFDLLVYADALVILRGYEKLNGLMRLNGRGGKRGWRTCRRKLAKKHPGASACPDQKRKRKNRNR